MQKLTYFFLILIVLLSVFLRFWKLDQTPPSITWDEATVGYNAYTILNWGKDEWGRTLPLTFKSFGDDKNPVHVYLTVPFVGLFGLNDYAVRSSAATFGVLNVILIFFLVRSIFKSNGLGLISSLFLALSPFNIQFSRFNHELNFAMFFFLLGLYFFYKAINGNIKYIIPSLLMFGVDLLTYQSAKVVTPVLVFLILFINLKLLWQNKKYLFFGISIYALFLSLLFIKPELLGGERLKQNQIPKEQIEKIGLAKIILGRYEKYFQTQFLFITGDTNSRHSIQTVGTFYWLDLPFLIVGLLGILARLFIKKDKQMLLVLIWALIAPIPAVVSSEAPHVARAMFLTGSWTIISAYGAYLVITAFKNKYYQVLMSILLILAITPYFYKYLKSYYTEYANKYAIEWVYGMKEVVEFSKKQDFYKVYMTDIRMQPYIFFLYYLKVPLPDYLATVKFNQTKSKPSNLISIFDNYQFVWNEIYSEPGDGILYVISPSIYDGLAFKNDFEVLNLIKYPNGNDAFYLISKKWIP
ncbi:hypothetical protein A2130_03450 [Candidatus Woesebacteria bacterium GWC2_33_12]|uniref:Glycosyltransferase RgtA/B/C/D-like domain-containing protein n=1 Tax=Candidatus Woesebacteria bacterium GW2011_GWB1_33_22 TaxID=1618566 RepID=A0A0F9ZMH3_9BACT|nr:MAG: hypothetical protein UR29_C0001G0008 [Candidatus Woesebacteria bacterium GW2011_GWC2_33_12]KKP42782.1 MAG: hypothetical protein UR33_C0001G0143 [Candidatus Woesebacteria bacterium GW2011_GWA2_33_20]KKP45443.1 MAG: hypothetical protein UR35_C0001G0040 [Candidatus Woesebacteria bacterium GW2011_GWB1_33_22]KKP47315.1 MAG: hypothetical protein UR37_C0001G0008 [Microgenomates group bacterium GW2011_GWC1_33_28]KKP51061.1 MAG: hypothetical protein UR41_C0001G0008 [Candidatus Woesebacteria bact